MSGDDGETVVHQASALSCGCRRKWQRPVFIRGARSRVNAEIPPMFDHHSMWKVMTIWLILGKDLRGKKFSWINWVMWTWHQCERVWKQHLCELQRSTLLSLVIIPSDLDHIFKMRLFDLLRPKILHYNAHFSIYVVLGGYQQQVRCWLFMSFHRTPLHMKYSHISCWRSHPVCDAFLFIFLFLFNFIYNCSFFPTTPTHSCCNQTVVLFTLYLHTILYVILLILIGKKFESHVSNSRPEGQIWPHFIWPQM